MSSSSTTDEENFVEFLNQNKPDKYLGKFNLMSYLEKNRQGYLFSNIDNKLQLCGLHAVNNLLKATNITLSTPIPGVIYNNPNYFTVSDMNESVDRVINDFRAKLRPDENPEYVENLPEIPTDIPGYNRTWTRSKLFGKYVEYKVGKKNSGPVSPRVLKEMIQRRGLILRLISSPLSLIDEETIDCMLKSDNNPELAEKQFFQFVNLYRCKDIRSPLGVDDLDILQRSRMNLILFCWKQNKAKPDDTKSVGHYICVTQNGIMIDNNIDMKESSIRQELVNVQSTKFTLENLIKLGVGELNANEELGFFAYEMIAQSTLKERSDKFGHHFAEGLLHIDRGIPGCDTKKQSRLISIRDQNIYWLKEDSWVRTTFGLLDRYMEKFAKPTKKRKYQELIETEVFPYFHPDCGVDGDDFYDVDVQEK